MRTDFKPLSRREFVGGGIALSGLASTGLSTMPNSAGASVAVPDTRPQAFRIIVDRTLPAADVIAHGRARGRDLLLPIDADPGSAWMNVIEPRLRAGPVPLAGLTTGATLFCLEYLSRGYGLKPTWRLDGGPRPPSEWLTQAFGVLAPQALSEQDRGEDLLDLGGGRARSVFAWLLAPTRM